MKTLLITEEFPPFKGGVANYYGNLAKFWPLGEGLLVLDNRNGELRRSSRLHLAWWPAVGALRRKLSGKPIDLVLVGQVLPYGTAALILSFFRPLRYAVFLHGLDLSLAVSHARKRFITGLILRRAVKIIAANSFVSQQAKENFPFLYDEPKVAVVNPGITSGVPYVRPEALAELRRVNNLPGKTVLFTLGRLVRRKGVDQVIRALSEMTASEREQIVYLIGGVGPDEEYIRNLVPADLREKIRFLGELNEQEKWEWLQLADIFIMPARNIAGDYEGFGIVYLEANLCGKPLIAGRSGGVSDAVKHELNGLLVDPEDVSDIKAAIIRLSGDAALREKLGQAGRKRALEEFSWEPQVTRLSEILKKSL